MIALLFPCRQTARSCSFIAVFVVFILLSFDAGQGRAAVLDRDTVWSGKVVLQEDLVIPRGITLTIEAGTEVVVAQTDSTKTDPLYLSPLVEITVRGHLEAEGEEDRPVRFLCEKSSAGGQWAGIIIDEGNAWLRQTEIRDADVGVHIINGWAKMKNSRLTGNRYGLIVQGLQSGAKVEKSVIAGNEYGILFLNGARLVRQESTVADNRKADVVERQQDIPGCEESGAAEPLPKSITATYGDESLLGTTTWQGRIVISGMVRLPVESRLLILPGTVVEFTRRDTNQDGIGENGLLLQGVVFAKGTAENPIVFRSAEAVRRMGDWDAINIMGSDGTQNLIEYCRIEDAYRGLHFHFANVAVNNATLRNNYRGIQFQESLVTVKNSLFRDNKSGIQARDAELLFVNNRLYNNYTGANFFRLNLVARHNRFSGNLEDGIRVREGRVAIDRNVMDANRFGIRISDAVYGSFNNNIINNNSETGLSLRNNDNIEVSGNVIQLNGLSGLTVQDSGGMIRNNLISDNGERGLGIDTFSGDLTGNNIVANGVFALDIDGPAAVNAAANWWGSPDVDAVISDRHDDPAVGEALTEPVSSKPVPFQWLHDAIKTDAAWHGDIRVGGRVIVGRDAVLTVAPAAQVVFSAGSGLQVEGTLHALGTEAERISFSWEEKAHEQADNDDDPVLDEVKFERARDSILQYCDFQNAAWAVHSHFTHLDVIGCRFTDNNGGIRFRSGPLEVRHSFFARNRIGVRAFAGNGILADNVFTDNETGIFVRSGGSGLQIHRNDIVANRRYSIRLGDFNNEDVDARENWWGEKGPLEMIFDERLEPGIGRVLFEPALREPVSPGFFERQEVR